MFNEYLPTAEDIRHYIDTDIARRFYRNFVEGIKQAERKAAESNAVQTRLGYS
jgi:hypothetical protein